MVRNAGKERLDQQGSRVSFRSTFPGFKGLALSSDPPGWIGPKPLWQKTAVGRFKYRGTGCGGAAQLRRCPIRYA